MKKYDFKNIERKWQKLWEEQGLYQADDFSKKPKYYALIEFPYPSGEGLHVGHVRSYTAIDAIARWRRMQGYNVLYPIGWDAFGLPTENFAIKNKVHPAVATAQNVKNFTRQIKSLGLSFDWSREINTTDPKYYKWTQWIFLQFFKAGLAYEATGLVNWCPSCKTGLANEEVVEGRCERCGAAVEKKERRQWYLKISAYAEKLLADLKRLEWPERIKIQQENWIGKSIGTEIEFRIQNSEFRIKVFTSRPDTIFGATFMVLAPEHDLINKLKDKIKNYQEVEKYAKEAVAKSSFERGKALKQKTGVELKGITAINPVNNVELPVYVADFVLIEYGTGAIMGVPAHDERDFAFAKAFNLPIIEVIKPGADSKKSLLMHLHDNDNTDVAQELRNISNPREYATPTARIFEIEQKNIEKVVEILKEGRVGTAKDYENIYGGQGFTLEIHPPRLDFNKVYVGDGLHINSDFLNGLNNNEAIKKANQWFVKNRVGSDKTIYRLHDWVFSRQRYWGEPIPLIFCPACKKLADNSEFRIQNSEFSKGELANPGWIAVPENELPVELPKVKSYEPTETGESPLSAIKDWVNTKCPKCGGPAKRETDTMPNWAGSNWYFMRYLDPNNDKEFAGRKKMDYWMPIDLYNGGMEHTTLHLLYSRFVYKFLYDQGFVPHSEPYAKRRSHGIVLAEDGRKMSKSYGNVVNPDDVVEKYGADTMRLYEMFMAPFEQMVAWSSKSIIGVYRFLERVWKLYYSQATKVPFVEQRAPLYVPELNKRINKLVQKITGDLEAMKFNTAVAAFMDFSNRMNKTENVAQEILEKYLILLAPFAPHLAEELWHLLGHETSVHKEPWPKIEEGGLKDETFELVVQVNGKVRDRIIIMRAGADQAEAEKLALASEKVQKYLQGKQPIKVIYTGKLINLVV